MVEKFFLALDYQSAVDVLMNGIDAIKFLENGYGKNFVQDRVGVKINEDMLGKIKEIKKQERFKEFYEKKGCTIFADRKISHGADTGKRIIGNLLEWLPADYVTVATDLGSGVLKDYVNIGKELGIKIIGFTKHTKTSAEDVQKDHNKPLPDVIYTRALMASEAGCDAAVMEAKMLNDERIRELPIKKLVTGIRIDVQDAGTQKRVSSLEDVANVKRLTDYAVVSSKYLGDNNLLKQVIDTLM